MKTASLSTRSVLARPIDYPESDGKPVAESDVHIDILLDVRARLKVWAAARESTYAAGNMFVYYEEGNPAARLAPDCFVVFGIEDYSRQSFKTWVEGAVPSVVFEFTSRSTRKEDLVKKYRIYRDVWAAAEYFLFDPLEAYLDPSLRGFRLVKGDYVPIPLVKGKLASAELGITMERDDRYLKLRDAKTGELLGLPSEKRASKAERRAAKAEKAGTAYLAALAQAEAEIARLKAENAAMKKKRSE